MSDHPEITAENALFLHPANMANIIAGTLQAMDLPLDADQQAALAVVADRFARGEAERKTLREVVDRWAADFPPGDFAPLAEPLDAEGILRVERVVLPTAPL